MQKVVIMTLSAYLKVGSSEIELTAIAIGGRIVPQFEGFNLNKLRKAGLVREPSFGTAKDRLLVIEKCSNSRAVTILVRESSTMLVKEEPKIVYEGGAAEISCSFAVAAYADQLASLEQCALRGFAEALESIPLSLAENSSLSAIHALAEVEAKQVGSGDPVLGIDCMQTDNSDMREQHIIYTF